jgi:ABC-type Na+ transport system ATPase subunit NatA
MTAVVKAQPLTKRFGEVPAVTDLSFVLEAGTITGFLGPNVLEATDFHPGRSGRDHLRMLGPLLMFPTRASIGC